MHQTITGRDFAHEYRDHWHGDIESEPVLTINGRTLTITEVWDFPPDSLHRDERIGWTLTEGCTPQARGTARWMQRRYHPTYEQPASMRAAIETWIMEAQR